MSASVDLLGPGFCRFCHSRGETLYFSQRDRLFGAPGLWNFRRCTNRNCGLMWLDPPPSSGDLSRAYANYYTHSPYSKTSRRSILAQAYAYARAGYISHKYKYAASRLKRWVGRSFYLLPFRRTDTDAEMRYLKFVPGGRLLDVGCGSGDWLRAMCERGWLGEGTDFDEQAVAAARAKGLRVHCGDLAELRFPSNSFDAVTMNHVIEHVRDPIDLVRECWRILRPGGRLVLATPNIDSLGHRLFKQNWRGLEPPRHLNIMSPATIADCLSAAGFRPVSVRTHNSTYVLRHSYLLAKRGEDACVTQVSSKPSLYPTVLAVAEQLLLLFRGRIGECISASGVKSVKQPS